MRIIYTIGIWLYTQGVRIAALCGHRNARLMVDGWKQWPSAVAKLSHELPTVWFHAASLGEFEQARPVLEEYRRRHPNHQVLVTFFSPSGYEVRKNYPLADAVCYLPMDTPRNVRRFVFNADPDTVFFVKYEFWYNYLNALKGCGTKTYIFSTIFRPGQYFFKWYGRWFRRQLKRCFTHLFVQNEESLRLLKGSGIEQCSLAGDTRFDRVYQIAQSSERNEVVERWLEATKHGHHAEDDKVIVCGSTWPPDEEILARFIKVTPRPLRMILAPHVISEDHLKQIEQRFPHSMRYSSIKNNADATATEGCNTLIIDNIGMLAQLYRYADVAYIGGGFGVGIHNILEAVAFGKPVIFGPNYHKFKEAHDIIAIGGGWSVANADELMHRLAPMVADRRAIDGPSQHCTEYMAPNIGSTNKILTTIE